MPGLAWFTGTEATYRCSGRAVTVRLPYNKGRGKSEASREFLEVQVILRAYNTPAEVWNHLQEPLVFALGTAGHA